MGGHVNALSSFETYKPFGAGFKMFQAKVIGNADDMLLGRIKCSIPDLLEGEDENKLPWIYPLYPAGLGQGPLTSSFCVPEKDSYVIVISPECSIYKMYYVWQKTDRKNRKMDFLSEYPDRYGWIDSMENKLIINKNQDVNTIEARAADGALFVHDSRNGKTTFTDMCGTYLQLDRTAQTIVFNYGQLRINYASGALDIDCPIINVKSTNGISIHSDAGTSINSKQINLLGTVSSPPPTVGTPSGK